VSALAGSGPLARLVLRRDRVILAVWILLAVAIPVANAASMAALLPTPQLRANFVAESATNPIINTMLGPIFEPAIESIVAWRSNVQCLLVAVLASSLLVVRHTRAEEEAGRSELVGSGPVGRHAPLTAALGVVVVTNLVAALLLAGTLIVGAGYPTEGSVLFALMFAGGGWLFAAVAGVAAQITRTAGKARSDSLAILAASFAPTLIIEGAGTISRLRWLSPVTWIRQAAPYAGDRWSMLLITVAVAAVVTAAAYVLSARRDLGMGMLPDRSGGIGPSQAPPALRSPLALAWRLHKDQLIAVGSALGMFSIVFGLTATSFDDLFGDLTIIADWLSTMRAETIGEAFLAVLSFDVRVIVACLAVATALRLRTEESSGRAEPLLAGPTSRSHWMRSHVVIAFAGPTAILIALSLAAGLAYGITAGRAGVVADQLEAAVRFLPAAWFVAAVAVALFGLLPRLAVPASWALMGAFMIVVFLWEMRAISQAVFVVSPFGYSHPAVQPTIVAPIGFTLAAGLLTAIGTLGFRRRDVDA
jgi:ABC-2 type transport system permease protein